MTHFDKHKRDNFPEIKDWTDPNPHPRKYIDKPEYTMIGNYTRYFFFDSTSCKITMFGFHISSIICFGLLGWWSLFREIYLITGIAILIVGHQTFKLIERIKNREVLKDSNLYDLFMREYPGDDTNE